MRSDASNVLKEALALEEVDRASVAGALLASLEGPPDEGAEAAWASEIDRRVAELAQGTVQTLPWSEVRERLFRGLG